VTLARPRLEVMHSRAGEEGAAWQKASKLRAQDFQKRDKGKATIMVNRWVQGGEQSFADAKANGKVAPQTDLCPTPHGRHQRRSQRHEATLCSPAWPEPPIRAAAITSTRPCSTVSGKTGSNRSRTEPPVSAVVNPKTANTLARAIAPSI
jgi:hypothetical protein